MCTVCFKSRQGLAVSSFWKLLCNTATDKLVQHAAVLGSRASPLALQGNRIMLVPQTLISHNGQRRCEQSCQCTIRPRQRWQKNKSHGMRYVYFLDDMCRIVLALRMQRVLQRLACNIPQKAAFLCLFTTKFHSPFDHIKFIVGFHQRPLGGIRLKAKRWLD